jgi:hypothetical protein
MKRGVEMPELGTSKKRLPPAPWTTLRVAHIPTSLTAGTDCLIGQKSDGEKRRLRDENSMTFKHHLTGR